MTPEQGHLAARGLAGEQPPDPDWCDCGEPALPCGLCPECCGTEEGEP